MVHPRSVRCRMVFSAYRRETGEALLQRYTNNRVFTDQVLKRGIRLGRPESRNLHHVERQRREGSKTIGKCAETGVKGGTAVSVQDEEAETVVGAEASLSNSRSSEYQSGQRRKVIQTPKNNHKHQNLILWSWKKLKLSSFLRSEIDQATGIIARKPNNTANISR